MYEYMCYTTVRQEKEALGVYIRHDMDSDWARRKVIRGVSFGIGQWDTMSYIKGLKFFMRDFKMSKESPEDFLYLIDKHQKPYSLIQKASL